MRYNKDVESPQISPRIVNAADGLAQAAELLQAGKLVAFPTETVYGLGASALDPAAVARVFAAKERPPANPLIVHVPDVAGARTLARHWPMVAEILAAHFWPGPLTLVVWKENAVPAVVTAGGPTVALRVPAHPVALKLLRLAGVPIAAPSANRSTEVSPTTAQHVARSLGDRVELILDGGPTDVGVESTVLDVTQTPPRLLRPGMVTEQMLRAVVGELAPNGGSETIARSPGLMTRHYAPRAPVVVVCEGEIGATLQPGDAVLARAPRPGTAANVVVLPTDAAPYAARLYAALRALDEAGAARIVVEKPPAGDAWDAIHDRLRRASSGGKP